MNRGSIVSIIVILSVITLGLAGCPGAGAGGGGAGAGGDGGGAVDDVVQVLAGYEWSLALGSDGSVWGWGWLHKADGTVEIASGAKVLSPVQLYPAILTDVKQVAGAYDHFYALLGDGRVLHWGRADLAADGRGTDGNGSSSGSPPSIRDNTTPVEVLLGPGTPVDRVCAIAASRSRLYMIRGVDAAGNPTSCAPGSNKTVWVAGSFNSDNSNPFVVATLLPGLPVPGDPDYSPVRSIFAGTTYSGTPPGLIVLENGRGYGIGVNPYNGFGFPVGAVPSYLGGRSGAVAIPTAWGAIRKAGFNFYYSFVAARADGSASASGYNSSGDLGVGEEGSVTVNGPRAVGSDDIDSIAFVDTLVTLFLRKGRILFSGSSSEAGITGPAGRASSVPVDLDFSLGGFKQISGGARHALAIGADGNVYAWGWGLRGALGDGVEGLTKTEPTLVPLP